MIAKIPWSSLLTASQKLAWILFLVCLPVTSFPIFPPALGGGALVRPLSIYPLVALLFLATFPRLLGKPLPRTLRSFLPFVLVVIAGSLLSLLRGIEPALGVSAAERMVRAWATLGIGAAVYFTVSLWPQTVEDLRSTLRWFYAGFSLALLWGSIQAVYVIKYIPEYFNLVSKIQRYVSIRKLFTTRISGPTYEPNWFAQQISFLLIPWLLASVLTGYSVFRWRRRWLTIELFLLAWSVGVLAFTFSRAGLMVLLALAFVGLLFFRPARLKTSGRSKPLLPGWARRVSEAGLAVAILVGFIFFAGSNNQFFSRLWNYWSTFQDANVEDYFDYIGFGARFTYVETAFRTYAAYPVLGVGLGNYAFYFDEMLPDQPLAITPEVLRLVTPDPGRDRLITTKNLYLRLLAETGLVGTAAFLAFVIAILGGALSLRLSQHPEKKYWGTAGIFGLFAFSLAALSFDSFTIPNMWVIFGLITASAWVLKRSSFDEKAGALQQTVASQEKAASYPALQNPVIAHQKDRPGPFLQAQQPDGKNAGRPLK